MEKVLIYLAILVALFFAGLWALKKGASALVQRPVAVQYGILTAICAGLAYITPASFLNAFLVYAVLIMGFCSCPSPTRNSPA